MTVRTKNKFKNYSLSHKLITNTKDAFGASLVLYFGPTAISRYPKDFAIVGIRSDEFRR